MSQRCSHFARITPGGRDVVQAVGTTNSRDLVALVGCTASTSEPAPSDDGRVGKTEQELLQGGCSNSQIRTLQSGCRSSCPGGSAGIDHCYPGTMTAGANVFLDVSEGGICVCN